MVALGSYWPVLVFTDASLQVPGNSGVHFPSLEKLLPCSWEDSWQLIGALEPRTPSASMEESAPGLVLWGSSLPCTLPVNQSLFQVEPGPPLSWLYYCMFCETRTFMHVFGRHVALMERSERLSRAPIYQVAASAGQSKSMKASS